MAIFLVDYENVGEDGMCGSRYLNDRDIVYIFYSEQRSKIANRYLMEIFESGCRFQVYKLKKSGKNALDFCIATVVGELIGQKKEDYIVIISRDKGFQALVDFWGERDWEKLILAADFAESILQMTSQTEEYRRMLIIDYVKHVDIGEEYIRYNAEGK